MELMPRSQLGHRVPVREVLAAEPTAHRADIAADDGRERSAGAHASLGVFVEQLDEPSA